MQFLVQTLRGFKKNIKKCFAHINMKKRPVSTSHIVEETPSRQTTLHPLVDVIKNCLGIAFDIKKGAQLKYGFLKKSFNYKCLLKKSTL